MRLKYGQAIQKAIEKEMLKNKNIVLFGEDIQSNLYGITDGFVEKFGKRRVLNIPLSEEGVVGVACGAAMCGMRPIVDLTVSNFLYVAMDQIVNMASKIKYMNNGLFDVPITIFVSSMEYSGNAAQHSDRVHSMLSTVPGLKIICPTTPQDAYSMMRGAIQDNNPVVYIANRGLFWRENNVDLNIVTFPGISNILQAGNDVTIITISSCTQMVLDILPDIHNRAISAEVIDLRTIKPLDYALIYESVRKTGKVIICDTACKTNSTASEIASNIQHNCFNYLKKPIEMVTAEDLNVPFARCLEDKVLVNKEKIYHAIINYMEDGVCGKGRD